MSLPTFSARAYEALARLGLALADPSRLKIVHLLAQSERSVEELASLLHQSAPNVSAHLKTLYQADLVVKRREGKRVYYGLSSPDVARLWMGMRDLGLTLNPELREGLREFEVDQPLETLDEVTLREGLSEGRWVLIDVRPEVEYAHGHLPGARRVDAGELDAFARSLGEEARVVVYCRGPFCEGAARALRVLTEMGVDACRWRGGVLEWQAQGCALVSGVDAPIAASVSGVDEVNS